MARQSICAICGRGIKPGGGVVREFGGSGRIHANKAQCHAADPTTIDNSDVDDPSTNDLPGIAAEGR